METLFRTRLRLAAILVLGCSSSGTPASGSGHGGVGGASGMGAVAGRGGSDASAEMGGASPIAGGAGQAGGGGQAGAADCSGFPIPPDHPNAAIAYVSSTDTVTDTVTGLMWQRNLGSTAPVSLGSQVCPYHPEGYSDWRLPTVLELATIIDFAAAAPSIDSASFPGISGDYFPTTTDVYADGVPPGQHNSTSFMKWVVDFRSGLTLNGTPPTGYIRCVRRASPGGCVSGSRFQVNEPPAAANRVATVLDRVTAIQWQRSPSPDLLTWEQAKAYCGSLGGAARLPGAKELLSLVDWQAPAAIDVDAFPGTPKESYWTAALAPGVTGEAVVVRFGDARYTGTASAPITEPHQVRCVFTP